METIEGADNLPSTLHHRTKGISWRKVFELKQRGLSHAQIGKLLGCSHQNITQLVKRYGREFEGLADFKESKGDYLLAKQRQLLDGITPKKIDKMSGKDLAISFGVIFDKHRLETGESTSNLSLFSRIVKEACETMPGDIEPSE
jgi:hypothetical protein